MTHTQIDSNAPDSSWFSNDRFGMFIHWGLYTGPGGVWKGKKIVRSYSEWLQSSESIPRNEYRKLTEQFNPDSFNAEEWIRMAKGAGMRYFLITAKHHDGFCLWPTKVSDYNVMDATPFKRDILGELASACKAHDIKLGFYYSHWMDWDGTGGDVWYGEDAIGEVSRETAEEYKHPTQEEFEVYWQKKCLPQVRELIENYDPRFFWFDSWGKDSSKYMTPERQDELINLIRECSDHCLVNSRINFEAPSDKCDYLSMMDNSFPDTTFDKPWETSGTLNHSWAYHKLDYDWKSTEQLIKYLVGNASLGGNYQLNVGPMPDGRFEAPAIRRLSEIGSWLTVNGEAIYGSSASPLEAMPFGKVTYRQEEATQTYYLHLWVFAPGSELFVPGLKGEISEAKVIENGQPLETRASEDGTYIQLPNELAGLNLPVIKLVVS
jgi:alpha-L-fucosidase